MFLFVSRTGAENAAPRFWFWRIKRTVIFTLQSIADFVPFSFHCFSLSYYYSEAFSNVGLTGELVCPFSFYLFLQSGFLRLIFKALWSEFAYVSYRVFGRISFSLNIVLRLVFRLGSLWASCWAVSLFCSFSLMYISRFAGSI